LAVPLREKTTCKGPSLLTSSQPASTNR
jgi:hypothetical protein